MTSVPASQKHEAYCPMWHQFLDAQRIHNLVTYLQELHNLGMANADHTTLLLNTYTKLKDVARLDSFIKTESRRPLNGEKDSLEEKDELPFDLDTAIRVCRQAGYFEHAGYLAKRWERHEDYLRIQVEDAGNFADALAYLRKLGPQAVCPFRPSCVLKNTDTGRRRNTVLQDMDALCSTLCRTRPHNFS